MGQKRAKVISRDAFVQSFVEAEMVMRHNLAARIETVIESEQNPDIIAGLRKAKEIVFGKVETQ
jgi:hypothetical protein